jgi:hypothetical protein
MRAISQSGSKLVRNYVGVLIRYTCMVLLLGLRRRQRRPMRAVQVLQGNPGWAGVSSYAADCLIRTVLQRWLSFVG